MNLKRLRELKESILTENTYASNSHDAIQNKENKSSTNNVKFKETDKVVVTGRKGEVIEVDDDRVKVLFDDDKSKENAKDYALFYSVDLVSMADKKDA